MTDKINAMREGGAKLAQIREQLLQAARSGSKTIALDQLAEKLIEAAGGKPSFKFVAGYKWSTCICVNECIVHGVPNNYRLKTGDLVTVDIGMLYRGFHTDTAATIIVGKPDDRFITTGKQALAKAINAAKSANRVGHISAAIQQVIEGAGYNVARALVGHGIGRQLHEDPQIPCFLEGKIDASPQLRTGMTLAIEVIYMEGRPRLQLDRQDNWTMRTTDGSRSGMFEHTVALTKDGLSILTR